ncbi:rab-GTPase-TBC domain-containing protein [Dipodascopsis uninucleata]
MEITAEESAASKKVQNKYQEGVELEKSLLAGGTENWQGVNSDDVDRYGFIVKPRRPESTATTSTRGLSSLRQVASNGSLHLFKKNPKVRAPQITEMGNGMKSEEEERAKEASREMKWRDMAVRIVSPATGLVSYEFDMNNKLVERTFKGIPDAWRAPAWKSFLTASARKREGFISDEELEELYPKYIEQLSSHDVQIDLDVPRTIDSHVMFSARYAGGQRLLFRVLHALSLHFPDIGYVQGMAPLAANLLCYYDEIMSFIMLVRLFTTRHLSLLYAHGFGGLLSAFDDFTNIINNRKVGHTLESLEIQPTVYATKWYLTLFSFSLPFSTQVRIWDVYFLLGDDGLDILHAASLTLLDSMKYALAHSDFEIAMQELTSYIDVQNPDLFMQILMYEWKHIRGSRRSLRRVGVFSKEKEREKEKS